MAQIIVLGAGMVGAGAALALQAHGHDVTLVDRRGPGEETSFGNAGFIQAEAVEPYPIPRDLRTLVAYAAGRTNDIVYAPGALPKMAPGLWSYFRNSAPARHRQISAIYARLTQRATADHQPLIAASGQDALIRRTGYGQVYRDPRALERAARGAERLQRDYGTASEVLDGPALARAEPALKTAVPGALFWHDCWTCADPGGLTAAYAALLVRRGGRFLTGDALSLAQSGAGWSVATKAGRIDAERVVVALGPWAPDLLARFGYRVAMLWKRGYHGHFDSPAALNRPLIDDANGVVMTPTRFGLRLATGAALVDRKAPADPVQLRRGAAAVADLIELGPRVEEPQWFGHRPCLPDMLPLLGEAPRHKGLWLDFGHGHQGFTLGPTTGLLLAEAMEGRRDALLDALAPAARPSVLR
ncbi:NAD(P)/FAD-dependent oxidoreductase [Paenirhodobacter hankyongi]|uniref:FAD-binding oxidoreductase n=1 Tax=Paenirhodobacter hankyongi TaxID=2294033 RepID=A0A421BVP0_9RHOB|nr:FAD-dependent oxidoreductase [Sinirhodobacter hankyongi]RLL72360.1 FAD-binding oxidoreductase [Sinirhodobacter hankyongi]